jgi:hypothetical protein
MAEEKKPPPVPPKSPTKCSCTLKGQSCPACTP